MAKIPTKKELEDFALNFDKKILEPLKEKAYYDQNNIFEVLKIQRQELIHSNMLAFLFDPKQSDFLKNFLRVLVETECISDFDFFDVFYGNIENVNIDREHYFIQDKKARKIDILLDFEITNGNQEKQKIVLVIENKVDSWQHDNQIKAYKEYIEGKSKYKNYRNKYYIYLTPNEADIIDDDKWEKIDYSLIDKVLKITSIYNTDESIKSLFEDYKKTVRSEFMSEEKTKELAKKIYSDERNFKVLEYIYNHVRPDWVKETSKILFNLINSVPGYCMVYETNKEIKKTNDNKGNYSLMFKPEHWIEKFPSHYFQINVEPMSLLFINEKGTREEKKYWLFDGDKKATELKTEEFKANIVNNQEKIEFECQSVVDKIFAPNGIVTEWVKKIEN